MRQFISVGDRGRRIRFLCLAAMAVLAVFVLSGCYLKLTGGGWMQSVNGVDKATFSVNYDVARAQTAPGQCGFDFEGAHIRGTYHDHGTDVRFKIDDEDLSVIGCFDPNPENAENNNCAFFMTSYESQDPKLPGEGTVFVTACDHGEPGDVDYLQIDVQSGPYAGYHNAGPVLGGNFQGHEPF
jgi:hypothetical protein